MRDDEYQRWILQIPELTQEQLTDVRRRAAVFIGGKQQGGVENQDWVLAGIISVLTERGLGHTIPANFRIRKASSFGAYSTQVDRVMLLLDQAIPNMTATERLGIGVLAARALADFIQSWGSTILSLDAMLRHVSRIPEALDIAYPSYIETGMLPFVLPSRR